MPYKDLEKQREFQLSWIKQRREDWIRENGPCVLCGSTENLECHHLNPDAKVTHRIWSWSDARRNSELEKCRVLCSECHKQETSRLRYLKVKHGTRTKYKNHGCRCPKCVEANRLIRSGVVPETVPREPEQLQLL